MTSKQSEEAEIRFEVKGLAGALNKLLAKTAEWTTDDYRKGIFEAVTEGFCIHCGQVGTPCHCTNDL